MSSRLFVGNLSWSIDTDQLRETFEEVGTVVFARVMLKPDGKSRGFGFVEMSNPEEAQAAIERFDGTDLGGRPVAVNIAKPREDDGGQRREFRPRDDSAPRYSNDRAPRDDYRAAAPRLHVEQGGMSSSEDDQDMAA
jgi:cold-inducible RNA-binding protein